ncbi:hypothetical protein WR25_19067 [Diploscapter pachys]|uniref:Pecanex-like protein n=1 Tax=Diploscapter pachys TaxID=2018661 RepID=A0A2A2L6G0_9BILA|nr:hypothetical protein WR25_19067 [Diploscapter pachys]
MYLWIILLIVPLFLGFYTEFNGFPFYLVIGYAVFIAVLFSIIKLIVAYFHMLFDTTDPVIVTKQAREVEDSEDTANNVEASSGFDHSDRFEMIELRELREAAATAISRHHRTASSSHGTSRRSSSSRRGDEPWVGSTRERRIRLENIGAGTTSGPPSGGWIGTQEEEIIEEDGKQEKEDETDAEVERVFRDKENLELTEGESSHIKPFNAMTTESLPSPRKMSEPSSSRKSRIDSETRKFSSDANLMSEKHDDNEPSTSSDTKAKVLRYNKDIDSDRFEEKRSILETLVDDVIEEEEHCDEQQATLAATDNVVELAEEPDEADADSDAQRLYNEDGSSAESLECLKWRYEGGHLTEDEYREQVSKRLILPAQPKKRTAKKPKSGPEGGRSKSTGSRSGQRPATATKRKRPSEDVRDLSLTHHRVSTSQEGPSTSRSDESNSDFKIEITRFLEELIDKHPETLDAIESVRLSRLNRVDQAGTSRRPERSPDRSRYHLADKAHVASGHEDTSEGAIHSFQDEHGNWWTYTFDEHGVGTAQALGSGRTLRKLMEKEQAAQRKNKSSSSEEESADDRSAGTSNPPGPSTSGQGQHSQSSGGRKSWRGTPIPAQMNQARDRAASSSSNESFTYIPQVPAAIFHGPFYGPTITNVPRGGRAHSVSFGSVASRLRAAIRHNSDERSGSELEEIVSSMTGNREHHPRGRGHADSAGTDAASGLSTTAGGAGGATSRFRFLQEMAVPSAATLASAAAASLHFSSSTTRRNSSIKKSYYYKMRLFPSASKRLKIKMDRLSLAALFDRNRHITSAMFDVILATLVSVLGSLLLATGIFFDLPLFFLCFTIAGSQFSLLKSVQPDAASPIHGFNWLVAYSRPFYFCLLATALLFIHHFCPNPHDIPWNFNVYRWNLTSWSMILVSFRDVVATCLTFLPIAFTIGWLPQVTTLLQHVLEQIEMNVFGGTASIGIASSAIQVTKSLFAYAALIVMCRFAHHVDSSSTQNLAFSAFLASAVGISYFLSRFSSNHHLNWLLVKSSIPLVHFNNLNEDSGSKESALPSDILYTVRLRGLCDILIAVLYATLAFALHTTSIFSTTQPYFTIISMSICVFFGVINHYFYNQLRIHNPWKIIANPILRSFEWSEFESVNAARLMTFEVLHVHMCFIERVILYPLVVLSFATECGWALPAKVILLPLICMRILRGGYSHPQLLYSPLAFSLIFCVADSGSGLPFGILKGVSCWSLMPLVLYISVVLYPKWLEFYLKLQFVLSYVAPWQISWGSAFHAFAQPFAVPHSALVAIQAFFSSLISAPLNPFLGSSFFTISYVRPVKFWERDYNTKRADASNTRLAFQFDRGAMVDDSNLNAIFYEHLTRSLQKSLAGDLAMGRWATSVQAGDCFILASFYLNCLVHIVEVGNGMVTFQLRGLEFRGTYCHQREVEAISEDLPESGFWLNCPCRFFPAILTMANSWSLRWLAWEVFLFSF